MGKTAISSRVSRRVNSGGGPRTEGSAEAARSGMATHGNRARATTEKPIKLGRRSTDEAEDVSRAAIYCVAGGKEKRRREAETRY